MDSINITNFKLEKANAMKKHRQLQKMAGLFRVLEVCVFLVWISRFSIQIPLTFKSSFEYVKGLTVMLASPCFVFIIGNMIVITLFAKSGRFSVQDSKVENSRNDIYKEFVEKSERRQTMYRDRAENRAQKQSKHVHYEEENIVPKQSDCVQYIITEPNNSVSLKSKKYQRSQSEKIKRLNCNSKSCQKLRRSATETHIKMVELSERGIVNSSYPEDRLSNEEFRCTIEAFIERQKRFRIDEENSVF